MLIKHALRYAAGGPPPTPTATWNPLDKTNMLLTGADLTATSTSTVDRALVRSSLPITRAVNAQTFGVLVNIIGSGGMGNKGIGFANSLWNNTKYLGQDLNGIGYYDDGGVYLNAVLLATLATWTTGDFPEAAYDGMTDTVEFRLNGGAWSAPFDVSSIVVSGFFCALNYDPVVTTADTTATFGPIL